MAEAQKSRLTFAHVEEGATTARAGKNAGNPYLPEVATVKEIVQETPNIKSLRVTFDDAEVMKTLASLRVRWVSWECSGWVNPPSPSTPAPTIRTTSSSRSSVSYTHLRAHETKANLVCRLLL